METLQGELQQGERRDRDHMVATKALIKEALAATGVVAKAGGTGSAARLVSSVARASASWRRSSWRRYGV